MLLSVDLYCPKILHKCVWLHWSGHEKKLWKLVYNGTFIAECLFQITNLDASAHIQHNLYPGFCHCEHHTCGKRKLGGASWNALSALFEKRYKKYVANNPQKKLPICSGKKSWFKRKKGFFSTREKPINSQVRYLLQLQRIFFSSQKQHCGLEGKQCILLCAGESWCLLYHSFCLSSINPLRMRKRRVWFTGYRPHGENFLFHN